MSRLVFVLLDGLGAATARRCMSCLRALTEAGQARFTELEAELPPLSRPLYATLLSGLSPARSGILRNDDARLCPAPTIFQRARDAGLSTAAAAYSWMSELCNRAPFEPERDRLTDDPALPIGHGLFYSQDAYPDDELFRDAEALRLRYGLICCWRIPWALISPGTRPERTRPPTAKPRARPTACWPVICRAGWTRAMPC